jgi:hypothetical protein
MNRSRFIKLLVLVAITLLAAFFRLYRIDTLPAAAGFDQAAYAMEALDILDGARPVFFETRHGREAMFSYLVALCFLAIGDLARSVYVTSAIAGILTVPATYLTAREMLADEEGTLGKYGALLAALFIALSHWHLSWSRLGMRVVLVPLLCALTTWLLWRGFRTGRRWAFAGAGVFLGLGMYTYPAFRAFPLAVVLAFVFRAWSYGSFCKNLRRLLLVTVVALVVFAPLGTYFVTHPTSSTRIVKATIVTDEANDWQTNARILLDQAVRVPLTLFVGGDVDPRVALPDSPALNAFLALALVCGVLIGLSRLRRSLYPTLFCWLVAMSLPAALATDGAVSKRAYGALPAVAILIAVGCLATWDALHSWTSCFGVGWTRRLSAVTALLIAAGFVYTGVRTYVDYFVIWGSDPDLFIHFEAGIAAVGAYVGELAPEEEVYLSPTPADHPTIELYSEQHTDVKTYHGKYCMVVPKQTEEDITYVVVPGEDRNSLQRLTEILPQGEVAATGSLHRGEPYYFAYHVPIGSTAQIKPLYVGKGDWDGKVALLGYDLDARVYAPGETIHLTLYLEVADEIDTRYTVFTHLLGPYNEATGGPLWAGDDSEPCRGIYPTHNWGVGEVLIDRYALHIPPGAPVGTYQIEVGFYSWRTMDRLPVLDDTGEIAGDHIILGTAQIATRSKERDAQLPLSIP